MLRPGNAGANTAADHKTVLAAALEQLPWRPGYRVGRKVLVRTDAGGGTHEFVNYCHNRRLQYSLGFGLTDALVEAVNKIPKKVWTPAYDAEGKVRAGAWVAELTGLAELSGWPEGMRLIVRKERPHPSPTPAAGSWPTWSYGIAAGLVARTASETPRTPASGIYRSTDSTRTGSGRRSPQSRWI
jgi:hypothetical protein